MLPLLIILMVLAALVLVAPLLLPGALITLAVLAVVNLAWRHHVKTLPH